MILVSAETVPEQDILFVEPVLEALYYKYAPQKIQLRVRAAHIPLFEHHPLLDKVFATSTAKNYLAIDLSCSNNYLGVEMPPLQKYAIMAGVLPVRATPKIFLSGIVPEHNDVLVTAPPEDKMWALPNTKNTGIPESAEDTRELLRRLASSPLVAGPNNWITQAAAALDAPLLIGMPTVQEERLRAPFNSIVTALSADAISSAFQEMAYERLYPNYMNQGNAAEWIKEHAKRYLKSNFVDVGCSAWPIPNGYPIDTNNREAIEEAQDGQFAGVFSSHCLEHIEDWEKELKLWHRIIRPGGILFMYLPHPSCEVWRAQTGSWVGKNHVWNPEPLTLVRHLREVLNMDIIEYTSRHDALWSFKVVARKAL